MTIYKTISTCILGSALLAGCAGTNETADNTGLEPTQVVVAETDVLTGTTPDGTPVVVTETEVVADTTIMTPTRENVSNMEADYNDVFDDMDDTEQYDVITLAKKNPDLSTFVELVELSGLAPSFMTTEGITVFAPTNAAFNELPQERLAELVDPANRDALANFLNLHILSGEIASAQFTDASFIDRGDEREDIAVSTESGIVTIGGATLLNSDVEAANGMLHVVDAIIETSPQAGPGIR